MRTSKAFDAGLTLIGAIILIPMIWIVVYSLGYSLGFIGRLSKGATLEHWQWALGSMSVLSSIGFSIGVAATVVFSATVLSLGLILLNPKIRNSPAFLSMVVLLLGTPSAIVGFLAYQILSGGGLLSRIAYGLRLIESPRDFPQWVNDTYAIGITVSLVVGATPLMSLYFSQLWTTLQADRLCQLAKSLGATERQARMKVVLPMMLIRSRAIIVLIFLLTLGSYEVPFLLGRQSPQMFSVLTQRRSGLFELAKRPEAFVLATIYLGLASLILCLYFRWRERVE